MKKSLTIIVITAAFLLISCGREATSVPYVNDENLCQIGDTLYDQQAGYRILNGALDTESRLCRDPLCRHAYNDYGCPESNRFSWIATEFRTDGQQLFRMTKDSDAQYEHYKKTGIKAQLRTIYAIDTAAQTMRAVADFEVSNYRYGPTFVVDDEYIYYKQGYILDPDGIDSSSQCMRVMRVKKTGSKPEDIFGKDMDVLDTFHSDGERYYLSCYDSRTELHVIDPGTMEERTFGMDGRELRRISEMNGTVFVTCFDGEIPVTGSKTEHTIFTYAVCRFDGENLACIAENISDPVFSGGYIWYSTPEAKFHGVVKPKTEMASAFDLLSHTAGDLIRLDPVTGETSRWTADKHIEVIGYSAGYALVNLVDYAEYAVSGVKDDTVYKLTLNDDGTVIVAGVIEEIER